MSTQLLTMTTTHKFPSLVEHAQLGVGVAGPGAGLALPVALQEVAHTLGPVLQGAVQIKLRLENLRKSALCTSSKP